MKLEEINNKTNEALRFLVAALESGESEVLTQYLNAMARFHTYSFGNIMLIARQKPTATRVAGIRTWNSLGRFVKRGEKGILILAPMVGRKMPTDGIATEIETDNSADERKPQQQLYGFRAVYVFDVSQTEGKELPTLTDVEGDVTGYRERLIEYVESQNIKLRYSEKIAPAKGSSSGGRITLLTGMQPAEEFSTLVHEMAHLCGAEIYVALASACAYGHTFWRRQTPHNFTSGYAEEVQVAHGVGADESLVFGRRAFAAEFPTS